MNMALKQKKYIFGNKKKTKGKVRDNLNSKDTSIILLGVIKAFDVTLNFNYKGLFRGPLFMNLECRRSTNRVHWLPLSVT